MTAIYDRIGEGYANLRRPDPRIAAAIDAALGDAKTLLNVGAGAGSYEPTDRQVTAVEPSAEMLAQRPEGSAEAIQGVAEDLPFEADSFDAAMGVLTIHHWSDKAKGLSEMRRVTRDRIVLLTFDPAHPGCWLTDYIPELRTLDEEQMPVMEDYVRWLGEVDVTPVPIPHDCTDGFLYAYWRRPEIYLDPAFRKGSSSFWKIDGVEDRLAQLQADLESGEWARRYGGLLEREELDCGYRLVVAQF